jgi:hypothetical protein
MNEKPSHALDFFQRVNIEGVAFLKSLINSDPPSFENDWLDFKGAEKIKDQDIKKIWSKVLAGFANTEGGVLVWGIDARKDPQTQVDCASNLSLVPNPAAFVSRLKELHSQSTDPPIPGVDFWFAVEDEEKDCGFVVSYVPESRHKPHRAEAAEKNYYIRAGDSFHVPSVALLRNLFFPEYHSHLFPELKVASDSNSIWIDGFIHNSGIATAKNVVLSVRYEAAPSWKLETVRRWEFVGSPHPNLRKSSGMACFLPIHPGSALPAFRLSRPRKIDGFLQTPYVEFEIYMYCENNQPLTSIVRLEEEDIEDEITKCGRSELAEIKRKGL